jgi:hypothetical protein
MPRLVLALPFVLAACARDASPPPASGTNPPVAAAPAAVAAVPHPATALDQLDDRAPVPLLPMMANHQKANMRDHLVVVQEIVAALVADDFASVEAAASRIAWSEREAQMCSHMGAAAPGFTDQALGFHRTADGIVAAARAKDRDKVLTELDATLKTCTACHAAWKQQVVDEATFTRLSGGAALGGATMPGLHQGH